MSSFARVSLAALCAAVLLISADVLLASRLAPDSLAWYGFLVRALLYGLAVAAAATAAARLGWWHGAAARAWTLFSLEFLLLLVNYILRRAAPDAALALNVTLIAANVAQGAAYYLMARLLSSTGIGYPMSGAKRALLTA